MEGVSFLSGTCYQYFLSVRNGILSVNYVDYSDRLIPWSGTHFFVTDRSFFVKLEGLLPCYKGLSMNPVLRRLNPVHSIACTSLDIDLSWLPILTPICRPFVTGFDELEWDLVASLTFQLWPAHLSCLPLSSVDCVSALWNEPVAVI